jgi:serine/threonine protein kinase
MTPNTKTTIPNPAANHFHWGILNHPPLRSAFSDLNLANVLVELNSDGQHSGVLADLDLSKDLEHRLREASMSAMSVAGARGTAGFLTMAPEVLHGGQPDFTADCYSFGGMVLQALFKSQADLWKQDGDDKRWDKDGAPLFTVVQDEMAHSLLSQALHRDKSRRLTSKQQASRSL